MLKHTLPDAAVAAAAALAAGRLAGILPAMSDPTVRSAAADPAISVAPHPTLTRFFARADDKREFVRRVFDGGAGSYDRIERLMALGSGSWYRREALQVAGLRTGMRVLDVATGTGLVAREAVALAGDPRLVTGVDPSAGMIAQAGRTLGCRLVRARAEHLPLPGGMFDFLSMGYALRHVADLAATFREFCRVLRPGGTACVLELTSPEGPIRRTLLRAYMKGLIPCLSRIATPERENRAGTTLLWRYYWETIEACVDPTTVMAAMREAGFVDVTRRVRFGIFSDYVGRRPG